MGSENEFDKIYAGYYQKIFRYLSHIVGENDAEDLAQEVFDKVNRHLQGFSGNSKLSTWIYRIATNTAIDRLRSSSHKLNMESISIENDTGTDDQTLQIDRSFQSTDHEVIRKEMSECVREFIGNLPPPYKTVIILSELEELSNQEIADILEISLDNVKIRLHRARAKLREALNNGCKFYYNEQNILACDRKENQILPKPPK